MQLLQLLRYEAWLERRRRIFYAVMAILSVAAQITIAVILYGRA